MEPSSAATLGYFNSVSESGGVAQFPSPILYNGALYQVMQLGGLFSTPAVAIFVYRSTDKGATWVPVDAAHGPVYSGAAGADFDGTGGAFFDGAHTIIVAFTPSGSAVGATLGPINLQNFDLSTGTWGAAYGTSGAPTCYQIGQAFQRPDTSILVFYADTRSGLKLVGQKAAVYAAGVWSTFAVDTNVGGGYTAEGGQIAAAMDATGRIHLFGIADNGPGILSQEVYYQAVNTDNSLGSSAVVLSPAALSKSQIAISGSSIVLGIFDNSSSPQVPLMAIGTGLAAPTFHTYGRAVFDPGAPAATNLNPPKFVVDGTGWYAAYQCSIGGIGAIRLLGNSTLANPASGWTGITAFLSSNPAFSALDALALSRQNGNTFAVALGLPAGFNQPTLYWFGAFTPLPIAGLSAPGGGAGGGRFKCCTPGYTYQQMRMADALRQSVQRRDEWPYEHVFPAPVSEVVEVFGSAATLAAGTLTPILTYLVPAGLRFFLTALLCDFLGASFNPGDALWTVDENFTVPSLQGSYVEGLIQWPVPAGSFAKGRRWKLPRAYEFAPLSVVRSTAVNVNLGVGAPNTYVSGFFGYLVPSAKGD